MGALRLLAVALLPVWLCAACTPRIDAGDKAREYNAQLQQMIEAPVVEVKETPYIGATPVDYTRDYTKYPIFSAQISLNMRGTLQEAAHTVGQMLQLSVQIESSDDEAASTTVRTVNFEGKALALLDYLSTLYGVAWTYDPLTKTVVFSRLQVRTFTILTAPGTLSHTTQMSSSSNQGGSGYGSGNDAGSDQGNSNSNQNNTTTSDTSQSLSGEYSVDVWADVENGVKALLSPQGTVTLNRGAGSIMVRDTVPVMRQVASYIEAINDVLLRQVALSVRVWSIDITDETDLGLSVGLLFQDNFKLASGLSVLSNMATGSLTATIVDGSLKDSSATLKALNTIGHASQVTSGSGVCMNNQPLPVQNVKRQSYLSSVSSFTPTTGGNTTALQPAQITYGFAMTVIPNILDRRRCVLQYNVGLSHLDKMEEVQSGNNSIQLPTVSIRSFNQRAYMNMGQTLVLAGFEQERDNDDTTAGLLSLGKKRQYGKSLIVITITLQSMNS